MSEPTTVAKRGYKRKHEKEEEARMAVDEFINKCDELCSRPYIVHYYYHAIKSAMFFKQNTFFAEPRLVGKSYALKYTICKLIKENPALSIRIRTLGRRALILYGDILQTNITGECNTRPRAERYVDVEIWDEYDMQWLRYRNAGVIICLCTPFDHFDVNAFRRNNFYIKRGNYASRNIIPLSVKYTIYRFIQKVNKRRVKRRFSLLTGYHILQYKQITAWLRIQQQQQRKNE
jgi:hypothetical protein